MKIKTNDRLGMVQRAASYLIVIVFLVAAAIIFWRYTGTDRVVEQPGEPTTHFPAPQILDWNRGLHFPTPEGTERAEDTGADGVEGVVRVPLRSPDTSEAEANGEVLLQVERQNVLFPQFRRWRAGVRVGILDAPYDAGEVQYAPQPRPLLALQFRPSFGVGYNRGGAFGYVAISPARVWGFEPMWFAGLDAGGFDTGPGVTVEVYDRLHVSATYGILTERYGVGLGYSF